jgi:hypothetical protein
MDAAAARALVARLQAGASTRIVDDLRQEPNTSDDVRSATISRIDDVEGAAAATLPSTDELASVLASLIGSSRTAEDIRDHSGVAWDSVKAAIACLSEREIIYEIVAGYYHARQGLCAGPCSRGGSDVRGQAVVVNAKTLRWMCETCWNVGAEPNRSIAPSGDRTVEDWEAGASLLEV